MINLLHHVTGIILSLQEWFDSHRHSNASHFWTIFTVTCLFTTISLEPSSYFLHWDVASQHVAALDFLKGCWGYDAGKPFIMFVIALTYGMFGANPLFEIAILVLAAGLTSGCIFLLAQTALPSRNSAWATAIWFLSWPTTLYYTRIHLGYALALFLTGLVAATRGRNVLSGCLLALGILAHPGLAAPALVWIAATIVFWQQKRLKRTVESVAGLIFTLLLLETVRFVYTGELFGWWQGQITDINAYASTGGGTRWSHVLEAFWLANGSVHSTICFIGITLFLGTWYRSRNSQGNPIFATALFLLIFYGVRTGIGIAGFNMRLLLGANPLLAITALTGIARSTLLSRWYRIPMARALSVTLLLAALVISITSVRRLSRSAYPTLNQVFLEASSLSVPVRYFGQPYPALFFGVKHNVETLANLTNFQNVPLHTPPAIVVVESDSHVDKQELGRHLRTHDDLQYDYRSFEHPVVSNRLRAMEQAFFPSTEELWQLARTPATVKPELSVWVPRDTLAVNHSNYSESGKISYEWMSYYYHGDGDCQITPRDHPYAWRYYLYLLPRMQEYFR